jgi:hypothetical protein
MKGAVPVESPAASPHSLPSNPPTLPPLMLSGAGSSSPQDPSAAVDSLTSALGAHGASVDALRIALDLLTWLVPLVPGEGLVALRESVTARASDRVTGPGGPLGVEWARFLGAVTAAEEVSGLYLMLHARGLMRTFLLTPLPASSVAGYNGVFASVCVACLQAGGRRDPSFDESKM